MEDAWGPPEVVWTNLVIRSPPSGTPIGKYGHEYLEIESIFDGVVPVGILVKNLPITTTYIYVPAACFRPPAACPPLRRFARCARAVSASRVRRGKMAALHVCAPQRADTSPQPMSPTVMVMVMEFLKHTGLEQVAAVGGSKTLRMT